MSRRNVREITGVGNIPEKNGWGEMTGSHAGLQLCTCSGHDYYL